MSTSSWKQRPIELASVAVDRLFVILASLTTLTEGGHAIFFVSAVNLSNPIIFCRPTTDAKCTLRRIF